MVFNTSCASEEQILLTNSPELLSFVLILLAVGVGFAVGYFTRLILQKIVIPPGNAVIIVPGVSPVPASADLARSESRGSTLSGDAISFSPSPLPPTVGVFVELLFSPGKPRPCRALEMYGTCQSARRGACRFNHGISVAEKIRQHLRTATSTVDMAAQAITSHQIADTLRTLHRSGVKVRVIRDYANLTLLKGMERINLLIAAGIEFKVNGTRRKYSDSHLTLQGLLHHKFVVIDGRLLIHGSSNFTLKAALQNFESVVVTDIPEVVAPFIRQFHLMWDDFSRTD
ncbi:putative Mitochondrial cardiolipin hydrolase [Hypsibius exemplaris]|uniref:Mitochondrial cardiolipin hydrolase n=1 Tax=Hypsibius exemplaris TaxID=2072580 RepID=A0A1W0WIA2_HYPEX|nr:putative Mitochondrial cardiolipin hydrolase [Hypsibius exemplaris]